MGQGRARQPRAMPAHTRTRSTLTDDEEDHERNDAPCVNGMSHRSTIEVETRKRGGRSESMKRKKVYTVEWRNAQVDKQKKKTFAFGEDIQKWAKYGGHGKAPPTQKFMTRALTVLLHVLWELGRLAAEPPLSRWVPAEIPASVDPRSRFLRHQTPRHTAVPAVLAKGCRGLDQDATPPHRIYALPAPSTHTSPPRSLCAMKCID